MKIPARYTAHLKMLAFTILISLSFPIGSHTTAQLDPLVVTWLRYLLASLLFLGLLIVNKRFYLPTIKDIARYTVISLPALTYFVTMFIALKDSSPLDTSALYTTIPIMSAVLATVILKRRTPITVIVALLGGMVGGGLIIFRGDLSAIGSISLTNSNQIYLLGCCAMALNPIVIRKYYRGESITHLTCWTLICAVGVLSLITAQKLSTVDWMALPPSIWAGVAYLAVFSTAISFFLFQQGSIALAPEQTSAYTYLMPVMVLLIGYLQGSSVPWEQVSTGVATVILSMAVMISRTSFIHALRQDKSSSTSSQ